MPLKSMPAVMTEIKAVQTQLGGKGRVLVRCSGTQHMCRVIVEGLKREEITPLADRIALQ